jgi:cell division protein FtsL
MPRTEDLQPDVPQPEKPVKEPTAIVQQRRLLNRWSLFALFFISAAATVLYVSNVIAVNKLSNDTEQLRRQSDSLETLVKSLRTESYRLQSAEHVTGVATEKLGMIPPPAAPVVIRE